VKIDNDKISDKILQIWWNCDSIYMQFNHIQRILSEILSLSIFTYKQCSKL